MVTVEEFYEQYYVKYPHVSTDTRTITEGSIFIALKGDTFDGNQYARKAIELGAICAIVDDPSCESDDCIYVENALQFLQELALCHRRHLSIPIIGVTGTNGKTTTKELIATVLSQSYRVDFTQGNLNNHIGVPLTILSIQKDTEIAVIEMGANHPGEIKTLVNIACPTCGIITNVGKAHLAGFGSFETIIQTKTELYEYLAAKDGLVFLDIDNPYLKENLRGVSTIERYSFSGATDAHYRGTMLDNGIYAAFTFEHEGEQIDIYSSLYGEYNAKNMLAAATIGSYFGVSMVQIKDAIEKYLPSNNRSQLKKTEHNTLILDAYNANPTSMRSSLQTFVAMKAERKCVILGEMFELGDFSEIEHRSILEILKGSTVSYIYLVGTWPHVDGVKALYFSTSAELRTYIEQHPLDQSTILVKGSRGVKLETIIDVL